MGKAKAGFLTPKAIANRIKAKGLQKLRWYCQMCQKQCRDEVTTHTQSQYSSTHTRTSYTYRIRSNYCPFPHNRPPLTFYLFSLIIAHLNFFFLTFYFIFT